MVLKKKRSGGLNCIHGIILLANLFHQMPKLSSLQTRSFSLSNPATEKPLFCLAKFIKINFHDVLWFKSGT